MNTGHEQLSTSTFYSRKLQRHIVNALAHLKAAGYSPNFAVLTMLGDNIYQQDDWIDWVDAEYIVYKEVKSRYCQGGFFND